MRRKRVLRAQPQPGQTAGDAGFVSQMSASATAAAATPLSALTERPAQRPRSARPATSRSRTAPFIFGLLAAARRRSKACSKATTCCAPGEACRGARRAASSGSAQGAGAFAGRGVGALVPPRDTLDFGNAGTGSRLMMGVVGGHGITATFDGDASLRKRPMSRILDPLRLMGAQVLAEAEGGRCPITLQGRARSGPDPLPHAGRLGADQIGGAARRPQRARRARP